MSVISRNPFLLLDDDADESPAPAPTPKVAAAKPVPAAAAKPAAKPARGDYPARGRPAKVFQGDREVNTEGPSTIENGKEDRAASFGGRGGARGGRGGRGRGANPRGNSGTYLGGDRPRRENGGGRPFDRHSQTGHKDSDKAEAAGWGAEEGKSELQAEVLGEADAKTEAAPEAAVPVIEEKTPVVEEEEDNTQTYEEYLAAQAASKLSLALPTARTANEGVDESKWKDTVAIARKGEVEEEWFLGTKKTEAAKVRKQKESKTFLEIDANFKPPRREGPPREGARGRGGRGRGEGRGRGSGVSRGAPRASVTPTVNFNDAKAFPTLA